MSRPLIGQVLSRMGKLTTIDIDEILVEQAVTHLRFGEIALSWGLFEPDHLCEAWCRQLAEGTARINLDEIGIDEQVLQTLPGELARRLGVIPIRSIADQIIMASSRAIDSAELLELLHATGKDVRFVQSDAAQIERAISRFYPPVCEAA
jgi:hypothetical protein